MDNNVVNELDYLNSINYNLVNIEGFLIFFVVLLLCYVVYKFFNIFFK